MAGRLRLIVYAIVLGLVGVACGDDDAASTTAAVASTTATKVPDTAAAANTTTTSKVPDTAAAASTTATKPPPDATKTVPVTAKTAVVPTTTRVATTAITIPPPILDPAAPANFGTETAASGFLLDPIAYRASAGGSIDVSYLGGGCVGFVSSAPDFDFELTGSTGTRLRFFFSPDDGVSDPVLIINGPNGSWFCNDDYAQPTRFPMIEFATGPNGHYDIWVGSLSPGTSFPGTLYITELDYNPVNFGQPGD